MARTAEWRSHDTIHHDTAGDLGLRTVPYKRDVRSGLYGSRYRTVVAPNGHSTGCTLYGPAPYSTGQKRVQTVRLRSYGSRDKLIVDGT